MLENNLNLLREAADAAGQIARTFFKKNPKVWYKDADQSPVTEADIIINEMLINKLKSARPEYGWLSEETEDDEKTAIRYWAAYRRHVPLHHLYSGLLRNVLGSRHGLRAIESSKKEAGQNLKLVRMPTPHPASWTRSMTANIKYERCELH